MVLCDNCKHPVDDVRTDSKFIKGQRIDMTYLYCKNCHAKFVSYFDDDKTRKLKEDIRRYVIEYLTRRTLPRGIVIWKRLTRSRKS